MKKIISLILLMAASLNAYAVPVSEGVELEVNRFEKVGKEVIIDMDIKTTGSKIHTTESWTLTPVITADGNAQKLPAIVINGNNKYKMARRAEVLNRPYLPESDPIIVENVRKKENKTISYRVAVPYEKWMKNSSLVIDEICMTCSKILKDTDDLAGIFVPVQEPYVIVPYISLVTPKQEERKGRAISNVAYVDFPVNKTEIYRTYHDNEQELNKIKSDLDVVKNNPDLTFQSITLDGSASPEGKYSNNERLARERVQALKAFVASNFNIPSNDIATSYIAEDWAGLKKFIEESSIEGREEILGIIDNMDDPDVKEAKLQRLHDGRPWKIIKSDMMPWLRRANYRVDFVVKEYDVKGSLKVLEENPELLSHYELHMLTEEYADIDSPEVARIYEIIERQFPNDDNANINVAGYKIHKGDYSGAKQALDRVKEKTPAYYNNYGLVLMLEGNFEESGRLLNQAKEQNSKEALKNLRELDQYMRTLQED